MKFTVPKKELSEALARVQQICGGNRDTVPACSCIYLSATETGLSISVNDLETGYKTAVPGLIWDKPFFRTVELLLPGKKLNECVKAIPIHEVTAKG